MATLERVQVLLKPAQRRALAMIARREGRSISEVLREMIEWGLTQRAQTNQRWKEALGRLGQMREANRERGGYPGDLVAEARAEREQQNEAIWRRSS